MAANPRRGSKVWRRDQGARLAPADEGWQDEPSQGPPHTGSRLDADDPHNLAKNLSEVEALRRRDGNCDFQI
jgi:hypothetical protein